MRQRQSTGTGHSDTNPGHTALQETETPAALVHDSSNVHANTLQTVEPTPPPVSGLEREHPLAPKSVSPQVPGQASPLSGARDASNIGYLQDISQRTLQYLDGLERTIQENLEETAQNSLHTIAEPTPQYWHTGPAPIADGTQNFRPVDNCIDPRILEK